MYCVFKVKGGNKAALIVAAVLLAAAIIVSLLVPEQESVSETAADTGDYTLVIDPGHGGIDGVLWQQTGPRRAI